MMMSMEDCLEAVEDVIRQCRGEGNVELDCISVMRNLSLIIGNYLSISESGDEEHLSELRDLHNLIGLLLVEWESKLSNPINVSGGRLRKKLNLPLVSYSYEQCYLYYAFK